MEHICIDSDGFMWCANGLRLIKSLQPVSNNGVGISDGIYERNISVFPNPVNEVTTFGYKLKAEARWCWTVEPHGHTVQI